MTISTQITTEDLMNRPEGDLQHELVRGELRTMPPAGKNHGEIEGLLFAEIRQFVKTHQLGKVTTGDTGYLLARNPDTVRAPDVGFISNQSIAKSDPKAHYWTLAPDLAIEILFPSDLIYEIEEKVEDFLAAGTKAVWVTSPRKRTLTVYVPNEKPVILWDKDIVTAPAILPGFTLSIADIFSSQ